MVKNQTSRLIVNIYIMLPVVSVLRSVCYEWHIHTFECDLLPAGVILPLLVSDCKTSVHSWVILTFFEDIFARLLLYFVVYHSVWNLVCLWKWPVWEPEGYDDRQRAGANFTLCFFLWWSHVDWQVKFVKLHGNIVSVNWIQMEHK